MIRPSFLMVAGGMAALGVAVLYFKGKMDGNGGGFFQTVGEGAGGAVVDLAGGVLAGAATTVGDAIGVPRTNLTECQKAIAEGRKWDASFACPAATFIKSFF